MALTQSRMKKLNVLANRIHFSCHMACGWMMTKKGILGYDYSLIGALGVLHFASCEESGHDKSGREF
jgi:hypothetical protein